LRPETISHRNIADELRKNLKKEWKDLWKNRYEDKFAAEGISTHRYGLLQVEKGQVIHTPREQITLDLDEIYENIMGVDYESVNPHPEVGGWGKFVKEKIYFKSQKERKRPEIKPDLTQQQRKGGNGWLNQIRINKKNK
jgi:hypothetical protein